MPLNDPVIADQTPAADFTIEQRWSRYTSDEHDIWNTLYAQQIEVLRGRAVPEFYDGLAALDLNQGGIPDLTKLNPKLKALTGWEVVMVPHLVPDDVFFTHLANKRFPAGRFIRGRDEWIICKSRMSFTIFSAMYPFSPSPFLLITCRPMVRGDYARWNMTA